MDREPFWIRYPDITAKLFSCWLAASTAAILVGWAVLDWSFVDPFLTTLLFVGSPFFYAMGAMMTRARQFDPNHPDLPLSAT